MSDNQQQLSQKRKDAARHIKAGLALHKQGKLDAARDAYRAALRIDREDPDTLHLLGVVENHRGDSKKAKMLIDKSLSIRPEFAPGFESLAKVYISQEKYADAIEAGRHALSLNSNLLSVFMPIAEAQLALGFPEEALKMYQIRDAAQPDDPTVLNNISVCLIELGRLEEACTLRHRALELQPDNYDRAYNLAVTLNMTSKFERALSITQQTLAKAPENVPALVVAGDSMQALGRLEDARVSFELAVSLAPEHAEAHFNLGLVLLTQGDLARGWEEYSWRKKTGAYEKFKPPLSAPLWNGENIKGKSLLLFPEQGMGDSINFIRYAKLVHEMGATVFCLCSTVLFKLFQTMDGIDEVILPGDELAIPDYQVAIMELPRIFKSTYDNIPMQDGYLKADNHDVKRSEEISVGIVWQGNPTLKNDANRSVPLSQFESLLNTKGTRFHSLQVGPGVEQIAILGWQERLINLASDFADFADTANAISTLDLVIAVDTSVAHLAGALGKQVWLLLPANADWRWGREGAVTPWYSSMRLFRQAEFGNWDDVFLQLADALVDLKENRDS